MSTDLIFVFEKRLLEGFLERIQLLEKEEPGKAFLVQVSINVVPDGMGIEAGKPEVTIVEGSTR